MRVKVSDAVRLAITMDEARKRGCLFCPRPASHVGIWEPAHRIAKRLGQPEGKQRLIVYALCERCAARPGVQHRIEKLVVRQATVRAADPIAN